MSSLSGAYREPPGRLLVVGLCSKSSKSAIVSAFRIAVARQVQIFQLQSLNLERRPSISDMRVSVSTQALLRPALKSTDGLPIASTCQCQRIYMRSYATPAQSQAKKDEPMMPILEGQSPEDTKKQMAMYERLRMMKEAPNLAVSKSLLSVRSFPLRDCVSANLYWRLRCVSLIQYVTIRLTYGHGSAHHITPIKRKQDLRDAETKASSYSFFKRKIPHWTRVRDTINLSVNAKKSVPFPCSSPSL